MVSKLNPATWQDLQIMVAQILNECGLKVEIEKKVKSVRSEIEVDVFAEEQVFNRPYVVLCECKFWKSRVPQNIIHGFRTVLSDIGANVGYIISLAGFQSGSFEASENTNIKLMTWAEFQDEYEEMWLQKYFIPTLSEKLDPLFTYTEPLRLTPEWFEFLTDHEKELYEDFYKKYLDFGIYMFHFSKWSHVVGFERSHIELPLIDKLQAKNIDIENVNIPIDILQEDAYREFLEKVLAYGATAISEFRSIRDVGMSRAGV